MAPADPSECGHLLCEVIGGPCSLASGRSRGCTPGLAPKVITPEVFDEVRALVAAIEPERPDEGVRSAAVRLAEIIRRVHARNDEPDLVPALERLCVRRR
jgi:hypothetical protein